MALFSEKQDAKPIAFFHGWPGMFDWNEINFKELLISTVFI